MARAANDAWPDVPGEELADEPNAKTVHDRAMELGEEQGQATGRLALPTLAEGRALAGCGHHPLQRDPPKGD